MSSRLYNVTYDANDPAALAGFWAAVLDWRVLGEEPEEVWIGASEDSFPQMCFLPVTSGKPGKNRVHLDLAPDDRDAEVERIIGLGARRVDIGQGDDVTWVVLADPEGNEFCVLQTRKAGEE